MSSLLVILPTSWRVAGAAVPWSWRAAGAGIAGFRRAGGLGGLRADVPDSPVSASMQARSVATSRRPSAGLSSAARSTHWSRQLRRRAAGSRAPHLAARRRPAHRLKRRCTQHASGRCSRTACSLQPLVGSRASPTHLRHRAACHHRRHPCPLRQSHADHPVTHARVCGKPARENSA